MACNLNGGIDLHIHTTASDGSLTPTEIIETARLLRLEAFSITDHDTIDGVKEILSAALPPNLQFVSGIEMSAAAPKSFGFGGSLHLLGYGINPDHDGLNELLVLLHQARDNRTPQIIDRLAGLGMQVSMAEIQKQVGDSMIGRPHIAAVLVARGYATSVNDAFDRFLGKGKPAYVDKVRIPCQRAIETIEAAGGIAVLAHPFLVDQDFNKIENLVDILIAMGLKGIECIYPEHPQPAVTFYQSLAGRKGLLITGGTDFHGSEIRPGIQLGSAAGDFHVPFELYQQLEIKLNAIKNGDTQLQSLRKPDPLSI